jgi:lysyl-tRNA synthetase class 1
LENPAWHIHGGTPPFEEAHLSYNILLNLVGVCNTEDKSVLWHFISRYRPGAAPENAPTLDRLTEYAIEYFRDFVKPGKAYRTPDDAERAALEALDAALAKLPGDAAAEDIQSQIYEIGKRHYGEDLKSWFTALYETLLGQSTGPRMGSFVALYGLDETRALLGRVLAGENLGAG